jgi:homoserine dehydrogenase
MAGVSDVFNAVMVYADGIDKAMFYGRGAGKLPTASAVLGDVIEAAKHNRTVFSQTWESSTDTSFIASVDDMKAKWYFSVPADTADLPEGTYTDYDKSSFVTEDELSFKEAEAKAKAMNATAWIPVLE